MKGLALIIAFAGLALATPVLAQEALPPPALTLEEQEEMKELEARVRRGAPNAAIKLADFLEEKGRHKEAERWYRHAFIQNSGRAGFALYLMHRQRVTALEYPDEIRRISIEEMERAAQAGDDSSALILGLAYLKGEYVSTDYDKALAFLELAHRKGKAMAAYHLGNIYSNGLFAPIQPHKALAYYKEASEQGIGDATRHLGLSYLTGIYHPRDIRQAIALLEKSVGQGNVEAMRDLANIYRYEERNASRYLYWMEKAADAGNSDAQYYMGLHFEKQDPARAKEFFMAAAMKHHLMARQKLPGMEDLRE